MTEYDRQDARFTRRVGYALVIVIALLALSATAQVPNSNDIIVPATDGKTYSCCPDGDVGGETVPLGFNGLAGALTNAGINAGIVGAPFSVNVCPFLNGDERLTATLSIVDSTGDNPATEGWTIESNCTGDDEALLEHDGGETGSGTFQIRAAQTTSDDSGDITWSYAADPGDDGFSFDDLIGAGANTASNETLEAVATFHNIGLYWDETANNTTNEVLCRYRVKNTSTWYRCPNLIWDDRASGTGTNQLPWGFLQSRGSILQEGTELGVDPDTTYQIEVLTENTRKLASAEVTTWDEDYAIAGTTTPNASYSTTQTFSSGGSAGTGYQRYFRSGGFTIDVNHDDGNIYCLRISASYVIVDGLVCRDADKYGIWIEAGVTNVVIRNSDISNIGTTDASGFGCNSTAGIFIGNTSSNTSMTDIVIENNRIHTPAFDANSWGESRITGNGCGPEGDPVHPAGLVGIDTKDLGGEIVIRYNEIEGSLATMFKDGIGGGQNFSHNGAYRQDFDVYGNDIRFTWDDCYQLEGATANARIYNNFSSTCFIHYGLAPVSIGPVYVMRNVATTSIKFAGQAGSHGFFIKNQGKPNSCGINQCEKGNANAFYVLHNTLYKTSTATGVNQQVQWVEEGVTEGHKWYNNVINSNAAMGSVNRGFAQSNSDWENNVYSNGHNFPNTDGTGDAANPAYDSGGGCAYNPASGSQQVNTGTVLPGLNYVADGNPDRGVMERGGTCPVFGNQ